LFDDIGKLECRFSNHVIERSSSSSWREEHTTAVTGAGAADGTYETQTKWTNSRLKVINTFKAFALTQNTASYI
jgi:hypothetical protein